MYSSDYRCIERQELKVLHRSLARRKQVDPCVCHYRPVAMFSGTIDPVKRLFMEYSLEMVFLGNFLHDDHKHHVLVDSLCRLTEYRSALKLVRCNLIMPCLKKDAEFICLCLKVFHE